ncbi:hypothetical protein GPECTOR_35g928 [Gonium pectorale]|uniref:Protein kinase domain-containing protein n=1 Tax=Gonium pectorale TaxID=33097 RepID=A0A150GDR4_GONPE|nr:hypothetical protein GPECTOR_35g928 [Gonium pectorale]|eukprot:KXZ47490.1 hypothetical protein GPECTOR_35g928 [Gonium pectorale]
MNDGQPYTAAPRSLTTLSSQQLAEGALVASVLSVWDFEGRPGIVAASPGTNVTLSCVIATNVTVAPPPGSGSGSSAFLAPTALDLSGASSLAMSGVSLSSDCATVLAYQEHLCGTYRVAGSLKLEPGAVRFTEWRDGFTSLRDVNLTCPSPGEAPPPPCWLVGVQTAGQLLEAFVSYAEQVAPDNVTIVLAANITIDAGSWPSTPVLISTGATLAGSSLLRRPVLDFRLMTGLWDVVPPGRVQIINLTCVNLAPAYFSPGYIFSQFGMLSERVWAFQRFDTSGNGYQMQLTVIDTTLIVQPDQLAYMRYWITFLVSPVPEAQEKASWLKIIKIKIKAVNGSGVYYEDVQSFTTTYYNCRIADSLDSTYPLLSQTTGLRDLLAGGIPLTAVNPVANASDFLLALGPNNSVPDDSNRRYFLLVGNVTLSDISSNASSNTFALYPGTMILGRGNVNGNLRFSFGGINDVVVVPQGSSVIFRQLLLSGLSNRSARYDAGDPLAVLAAPLWGLALAAGSGKARLENVTVLLSRDELRLLQTCLLPAAQAQELPGARAYERVFLAAAQQFFAAGGVTQLAGYGPTYLTVISGETQRYTVSNVTFRTPVAADGETAAADFATLGVPDGSSSGGGGSGSGGGLEGWQIGAIVGGVVGGALLLAAAFVGTLIVRRRRQHGGQDAYMKYLQGSAGTADRPQAGPGVSGAGGAYPDTPSQELTNSSQVMRPGARNSDIECATVGVSKLSGGVGTVGRSGSTTGGISQETSSGAVAASGSAGIGASRVTGKSPAAAAAAALLGGGGGSSMEYGRNHAATDSFERPPTASNLGQHAPSGRTGHQRLGSGGTVASAGYSASAPPGPPHVDSGGAASSILTTGGGSAALDQMHAMIQVLGRDFNDKQLEVQGLLGKGAHGTVYKGKWRGLPVAVKSMIFNSESSARQQQRPLMEAAISSNLAHPNIVTTYSYELREVEHELASLSPELARQGGGWRLLIIQEYCDAGPLRRLVDCGYFLTPVRVPQPPPQQPRSKLKLGSLLRKDSPSGASASDGSAGAANRSDREATPTAGPQGAYGSSRGSSGSEHGAGGPGGNGAGNGGRGLVMSDAASTAIMTHGLAGGRGSATVGGAGAGAAQSGPSSPAAAVVQQLPKLALEDVPHDVPPRPASGLEAARRYVEAALMMARGLQHIHEKSIVHGDLNPNNVLLVRAPGTPLGFCLKLADFGLSVRMAEGESHMSNLFQGSPYYCAPEVVLSGKVGKSADIYSLGIMLWELQNGTRPPWRMGARLRTFPSLNTSELEFSPDTPPRYARLARDCFHGSKDARPAIGAVVEALAAIKGELDAIH